jgi:adenine-specific DNA-methyltransferase
MSEQQADKVSLASADVVDERLEQLKSLYPEAFAEGKVDLERLSAALGDVAEPQRERYGLNWAGKSEAIKAIQSRSVGTLKPDRDRSVNFDTTGNLFIEGDNLEVLKLLQRSYHGQVKMIYIDPPYNSTSDLIYPDNFEEGLKDYLLYTRQITSTGERTTSLVDTGGRIHSKWLRMMLPRLFLSRQLLDEDGVIFVSIDDKEVANLRLLMNEVFGEECFAGQFIWHAKKGGGGGVGTIVTEHEYVLAYTRNDPKRAIAKIQMAAEPLDREDSNGSFRRGRELNKWGAGSARSDRRTMYFPIPGPNQEDVFPIRNDGAEGRWRKGKTKMLKLAADGNIEFESRGDGTFICYEKIRSTEGRMKAFRSQLLKVGTAAEGTAELKDLFGNSPPFDFPKPTSLLRHLMDVAGVDDGDIVLDFFAGSGSTGAAVWRRNFDDDVHASFVLVQLPEIAKEGSSAHRAGFKNIADVCIERLKREASKVAAEKDSTLPFGEQSNGFDKGFKVVRLDVSNFKVWDSEEAGKMSTQSTQNLMEYMQNHVHNVLAGASDADIIFELMLKSGIDLSARRESVKLGAADVWRIDEGEVVICLTPSVTTEIIREIIAINPKRVICLDRCFTGDDALKTNTVLEMKSHNIRFQTA